MLKIFLIIISIILILGLLWIFGVFDKIRYHREFRKKCIRTAPCQCCAYWSIRKKECELDRKLREKYNIL